MALILELLAILFMGAIFAASAGAFFRERFKHSKVAWTFVGLLAIGSTISLLWPFLGHLRASLGVQASETSKPSQSSDLAASMAPPINPLSADHQTVSDRTNTGDWTQNVVKTAQGGFRMGNPEAPVKLVEYGSLSCAHCAEFEEEGVPTLRETYVKSGQVSWEFRTYLLFPTDPGISLLLNCQSADVFFLAVEQLYKDQRNWMTKIQQMPQDQLTALGTMPPREGAATVVRVAGLDEFFRQRGMPRAQIQSCLSDPAGLEKVAEIKRKGDEAGVNGTPSFFINGKFVESAANWRGLEPALREAIGS